MHRHLTGVRLSVAAALGAAATLAVPVAPAAAAAGKVAVVVRFSGTSTKTKCVAVGGTGLDVLKRGFPKTDVGSGGPYAGFVLKINNVGQSPPDDTHYWSYWHLSGSGSWKYSSTGAGSYTPKAGAVEGWSYVDGQSTAPPPPRESYTAVCGPSAPTHSATPTVTPTVTPTPTPRPTTAHPTHHTSAAPTHAVAAAAPTSTRLRSASAHASSTHARRHTRAAPATSPPTSSTPSPTTRVVPAAPAPSLLSASPAAAHPSTSGVRTWGTIGAFAVIALLGAGAYLRLRRRPE